MAKPDSVDRLLDALKQLLEQQQTQVGSSYSGSDDKLLHLIETMTNVIGDIVGKVSDLVEVTGDLNHRVAELEQRLDQ
jgi:hypothetical protein